MVVTKRHVSVVLHDAYGFTPWMSLRRVRGSGTSAHGALIDKMLALV